MKVLFYSSKSFEMAYLKAAIPDQLSADFINDRLSMETAALAGGYEAICIFTADDASAEIIHQLKGLGVKFIAIRATGIDNVDITAAESAGIRVANVPGYSPNSIAEHAVALMLALTRKLIKANEQVHNQNFALDGLIGFDLNAKKVGIVGTGRTGITIAKILAGFGCTVMAHDIVHDTEAAQKYNFTYTGLETLCAECDIITLHLPLNAKTKYIVNKTLINTMKPGVMLINTSRGGVVNTKEVTDALISGQIGYYGMDVYEREQGVFLYDHTGKTLDDDLLKTLMSLPNVLITPHQGFATQEALSSIATTTFKNLLQWSNGERAENDLASV
jgi:D-lactate dehydrogenase